MWIFEKTSRFLVFVALLSSGNCKPFSLDEYQYAPGHDYKTNDYSFSYGVKDLHTGDIKHQWEQKHGDLVKGHYSMVEADGRIRIVDYTADSKNGFNAVVKHKGHASHPHTKGKSHSSLKLLPQHEETLIRALLEEEPHVEAHFESDHGAISLNEGEKYEFPTSVPHFASTESNEVAPVKSTYIYIPKPEEGAKKNKFKPYVPKVQYQASRDELPIDLSLLKQDQKILPVDVSLIKPIEIDLSQNYHGEDTQKELSQEELKKFLDDYYKGEYNMAGGEDFHPPAGANSKRPVTTPGLGSYSTQSGYDYPKPTRQPSFDRRGSLRPVQFPPIDAQNNQLKRMLRRIANNGYVRYARTVTYGEEK